MPALPAGFHSPRLIAPGIVAVGAPPHRLPRGCPDPLVEGLFCDWLAAWPERDSFPLIVLADDPNFCAASFDNFLWVAFTRSDPAADVHGARARVAAKRWSCEAPLVIDARKKSFHAPELEEDPEVSARIESRAARGGPLWGLF